MSIHNILKNSSKFLTVLTLSASLFLSINGNSAALVADANTQVVVDPICDLAIKVNKKVDYAGLTDYLAVRGVRDFQKELFDIKHIPVLNTTFFLPKEPKQFGPGISISASCYNREYTFDDFNKSFLRREAYYDPFTYTVNYEYQNFFDGTKALGGSVIISPTKANFCKNLGLEPETCNIIKNYKEVYIGGADGHAYYHYFTAKGKTYLIDTGKYFSYHQDINNPVKITKIDNNNHLGLQINSLKPSTATTKIIETCFPDVEYNHTFNTYICNLKKDRVIGGYPDGTYQPESLVSRAAMAKFIKNGFKIPTNTSCGDFSDVPKSHPFYTHITSLKCAGVIGGFPDGTYKPESFVDRGSMSKFIVNGSGLSLGGSCSQFSDVNINHPFAPYIRTLKCRNIIGGYPDGTYQPEAQVSRGAMAKFIDNAR